MFYLCREYASGFRSGRDYSEKNSHSVIGISILDFILNKEERSFFNEYFFMNKKTNFVLTDIIKCYIIELPKLVNATEEEKNSNVYKWARLFSATSWEEYEKLGKECESMSEAVSELKKINSSEVERVAYLHREIAIMDENQRLNSAASQGIELGRQRGIQEGIELGKQEGIQEGIDRFSKLTSILVDNNKFDELKRACDDSNYRDKLFIEYNL